MKDTHLCRQPTTGTASLRTPTISADGWKPSLSEVVQPYLDGFTASHLWPVAISTLRGHQMMSRATSESSSPFSLENYKPGYLMSLTRSSPGQIFLAFCSPRLRKMLLNHLYDSEPSAPLPTRSQLRKRLETVRRDGFAFSTILFAGEHAYAIPVFVDDKFHSALSLRYVASAYSADAILDATLDPLQTLSNNISAALEASPAEANLPSS